MSFKVYNFAPRSHLVRFSKEKGLVYIQKISVFVSADHDRGIYQTIRLNLHTCVLIAVATVDDISCYSALWEDVEQVMELVVPSANDQRVERAA